MNRLLKLGAFALKVYMMHLLVFTIGVIVGGVMGLGISQAVFVAMLKTKGLL